MDKIAIYGAGGLGKETETLITSINAVKCYWNFIGFIDDDLTKTNVLGDIHWLNNLDENLNLVIAIGDPMVKQKVFESITNPRITFPVLIHPNVIIGNQNTVNLGSGTVITAGCILTTEITIGPHVLVNLNTTVGHNSTCESYSSIMPGVNIAGNVKIGSKVFIGSGSNIINSVTINDNATVGAGSVVISDVDAGSTVVGVPAQKIS